MIRLQRALAQVDMINAVTGQLNELNLAQLLRRGDHDTIHDGYPTQTVPDVIVASHPSALTSVESAAEARSFGQVEPDPVGLSIRNIFAYVAEMAGIARAMDRSLQYVAHAHDAATGRVGSLAGDCSACDRPVAGTPNDRIRSGYCPACYQAWRRLGMPDRAAFEQQRAPWQSGVRMRQL